MPPVDPKILNPARAAQALVFFISSIRDPHNPRHCGNCLHGALIACTLHERQSFTKKELLDGSMKIPRSYPRLFDAILAFLLVERTDEQMDRLLTQLSECRCRMDEDEVMMPWYHDHGERNAVLRMAETYMDEYDPSEVTIEVSIGSKTFTKGRCGFFKDIFNILHVPLAFSQIKQAGKGTARSWPVSATNLIPFGADNFVQTMLQWYRFVPDTSVFRVMDLVLRICQSLVLQSFIKYRFADTLVQSTRLMVDRTLADISLENPPPKRTLNRFHRHFMDVLSCARVAHHDLDYNSRVALFRGCETKTMQLCNILLYLSAELSPPIGCTIPEVDDLVLFGYDLYRFCYLYLSPRRPMPVHPLVHQLDEWAISQHDPIIGTQKEIIRIIRLFRREARCSAQGCLNSIQSAGKNFQRCGGCGVVSYCGRECQTKAWKEERYPHKRLCPIFRNLIEKGGGATLFFYGAQFGIAVDDMYFAVYPRILDNWKIVHLDEEELALVENWEDSVSKSRRYTTPDGTKATEKVLDPGYDDYAEVIATLSAEGRGPKAKYLRRFKLSHEVAKELRMWKLLPFWELEDVTEIYAD